MLALMLLVQLVHTEESEGESANEAKPNRKSRRIILFRRFRRVKPKAKAAEPSAESEAPSQDEEENTNHFKFFINRCIPNTQNLEVELRRQF